MPTFRAPSLLAWLLLIAGLALFIGLGRWQYGKAEYKQTRAQAWQSANTAPLRALAETDQQRADGFDRVRVRGVWLSQRYLLDNQVREQRLGVEVYAPLHSEDGSVLLVALGWLPYADAGRTPPALPAANAGTVELIGVLAPPPAHGVRLGRDWDRQVGYPKLLPYFDLAQIAADAQLPLLPRVLRVDADAGSGYRRDWQPGHSLPPARHRAYAWQWWSLAATCVIVFLVVHRKRTP